MVVRPTISIPTRLSFRVGGKTGVGGLLDLGPLLSSLQNLVYILAFNVPDKTQTHGLFDTLDGFYSKCRTSPSTLSRSTSLSLAAHLPQEMTEVAPKTGLYLTHHLRYFLVTVHETLVSSSLERKRPVRPFKRTL